MKKNKNKKQNETKKQTKNPVRNAERFVAISRVDACRVATTTDAATDKLNVLMTMTFFFTVSGDKHDIPFPCSSSQRYLRLLQYEKFVDCFS